MDLSPFFSLDILPPVGECIYCRATGTLTDEHIIPYSLGGKLVLPKASCTKCNTITHKFEGAVARRVFGQFRAAYNVQTRRPDEQPKHVKIRTSSGTLKWVPIEDVPDMLFVPRSYEPAILLRPFGTEPPHPWGYGNWALFDPNDLNRFQETHDWDGTHFVDKQPWHFGRMLAKIGYSFAVAQLGIGAFDPLVLDIISGQTQDLTDLIGTHTATQHPDLQYMHDILLFAICHYNDRDTVYVAADIRLFANYNLPKYIVVIGIIKGGKTVYSFTDKPRYRQTIESTIARR